MFGRSLESLFIHKSSAPEISRIGNLGRFLNTIMLETTDLHLLGSDNGIFEFWFQHIHIFLT